MAVSIPGADLEADRGAGLTAARAGASAVPMASALVQAFPHKVPYWNGILIYCIFWGSFADPGSGAFLTPGSGIRDGKKTRIRIPDHISESLETIFCVKILKFFDADPGSGTEKIRIRYPGWKKFGSGIRDKHPGSATLFWGVGSHQM